MPYPILNGYTLVFDLDGTLVDTAADLVHSLNHVLGTVSLSPLPMSEVHHLIGGGARALLLKGLEHNQQHPEDYDIPTLVNTFIADYKTHISSKSPLYPECHHILQNCLKAGAKLSVCTNKHEALALQLLNELNITSLFHSIIGGNTIAVSKPDPRPLRTAIARAGGDESRAILIGDSITDLMTARNANIPFIGVSFGYSSPPMTELCPDYLIHHYEELPSALHATISRSIS